MAQKTVVSLIDDLDGGEASETTIFGLDGRTYEIDLNDKNTKKLRDFLEKYAAAGRRQAKSGTAAPSKTKRSAASAGSGDTAEIRAWAKGQGMNVNDRGRVPQEIREAYENRG
ncbi:Lsr2 family protein [Streptomyces sp. NPDC051546]|uniref:Lsr2 family protein n=1 Tax=Streptomyces sp. NPDC051546 TaxID=3365655 RepID=UPI0037902BDE